MTGVSDAVRGPWMAAPICDHGGNYVYPRLDGPAVLQEQCSRPAVIRYRTKGAVEEWWDHRCGGHDFIDREVCVVESLAALNAASGEVS